MLRTIAIGTLMLAGASAGAYADVYRWVDDHGGVHYSDRWVAGSEVIKTTKPHPATTGADTSRRAASTQKVMASNTPAQATQQNAAKVAVKEDVAKARDTQCKDAKDRYEKSVQARRIYKPGKGKDTSVDTDRPADREYLSDEEADAYRLKARTDMQEACGPSATK